MQTEADRMSVSCLVGVGRFLLRVRAASWQRPCYKYTAFFVVHLLQRGIEGAKNCLLTVKLYNNTPGRQGTKKGPTVTVEKAALSVPLVR